MLKGDCDSNNSNDPEYHSWPDYLGHFQAFRTNKIMHNLSFVVMKSCNQKHAFLSLQYHAWTLAWLKKLENSVSLGKLEEK